LVSRVDERGPKELITDEAFEELQEAMKRGEISTVAQAHEFLVNRGIGYTHPESVGGLLRRRKAKLKTGRPRHEKADPQEQEDFNKVLSKSREAQGGAPRKATEGFGFRRSALRADQLAQKTLLPEGLSATLHR
jgi:hypothetical protein